MSEKASCDNCNEFDRECRWCLVAETKAHIERNKDAYVRMGEL